jgi:hypothetical protein
MRNVDAVTDFGQRRLGDIQEMQTVLQVAAGQNPQGYWLPRSTPLVAFARQARTVRTAEVLEARADAA